MTNARETLEAMAKAIEALGPLDLANYQHQRMVARAAFLAFAKCEPSHGQALVGFEEACKFGVYEKPAFDLAENCYRAMLAQAVKEIGDE